MNEVFVTNCAPPIKIKKQTATKMVAAWLFLYPYMLLQKFPFYSLPSVASELVIFISC